MIRSDYEECMQLTRRPDEKNEDGEVICRFRLRIVDTCSCFDTNVRVRSEEKHGNPKYDDDEVIVNRQSDFRSCACYKSITIYTHVHTNIDEVGKQLWKSSFILADFLVHLHLQERLQERYVFEFGTGVGFLSVVLNLVEHNGACCTDRDERILDITRRNVHANSHLYSHDDDKKCTQVRCLDWRYGPNGMDPSILAELRSHIGVMYIASDCIYDDELTDLFFETAARLMTYEDVLYVGLDKRYNFEVESMSLVAHAYDKFKKVMASELSFVTETVTFEGSMLDLRQIPMYLCHYERSASMELWEIKLKNIQSPPPPPLSKRRRRNAIRPNSYEAEALAEIGVQYNMSRLMTEEICHTEEKKTEEGKDRAS